MTSTESNLEKSFCCIRTRKSDKVFLVGGTQERFSGSKLPARGEVLQVLFHFHNDKKLSLKDSISNTAEMLFHVWEKARIPTKGPNHVIEHIRKLHSEWQGLKKLINRKSVKNLSNQQLFQGSLKDLFDIAHQNAMSLIKIEEDHNFLTAQREKGRRGSMTGVDRKLAQKEDRVMKRKAAEEQRAVKAKSACVSITSGDLKGLTSSSSSSSEVSEPEEEFPVPKTSRSCKPQKASTVSVLNPEVVGAFDRTNTSDRKAAHVLSALGSTRQFQGDPTQLAVSYSSVRRARMKHRKAVALELKSSFQPTVPLILHWDGKLLVNFTVSASGREHVERLPILVSGQNVVKLLSVPKLPSGSANCMTTAVINTVDDWGLRDRIKGLCFDTTASNTGSKGGACVLLENHFGHELLNLACRHHIAELVLQAVFELHDVSKSSDIEIFARFRDYWPRITQTSFSTAWQDEAVAPLIAAWKDDVIDFALRQLENLQPRDDYRELLELSVIFLGGTPPNGIKFRHPGAVHRARWMARTIYCLKMWLFRNEYPLQQPSRKTRQLAYSKQIWDHLQRVCLFVTHVYLKYWFETPLSTAAPRNDLNFLCMLNNYSDRKVADVATAAFSRHLWYLSELLIGFSFFDNAVDVSEKRLMVAALRETSGDDKPLKRIQMFRDPEQKGLHDFVTKSTNIFFSLLDISLDFLNTDPAEWGKQETYLNGQTIAKSVRVVNDVAERGVSLIQQFNASITRDEEQKQYLLQIVEHHRQAFAGFKKTVAKQ